MMAPEVCQAACQDRRRPCPAGAPRGRHARPARACRPPPLDRSQDTGRHVTGL